MHARLPPFLVKLIYQPEHFMLYEDNPPLAHAGVYGIFNSKNGKWYIGETQNIRQRYTDWAFQRRRVNPRVRLSKTIVHHGINAFIFIPLVYTFGEDRRYRRQIESTYICQLNSIANGYNIVEHLFGPYRNSYGPAFAETMRLTRNQPEQLERARRKSKANMTDPEFKAKAVATLARVGKLAAKQGAARLVQLWTDPIWAEEQRARIQAGHARPEVRIKVLAVNKRINSNPAVRAKLSASGFIAQNRPEVRANNSLKVTASWDRRREMYGPNGRRS